MVDIKELFNISNTDAVSCRTAQTPSLESLWKEGDPWWSDEKNTYKQVPISSIVGWVSTAPIPKTKKKRARRQISSEWTVTPEIPPPCPEGSPHKHSTKSLKPQALVQEWEWGSSIITTRFLCLFPDGSESRNKEAIGPPIDIQIPPTKVLFLYVFGVQIPKLRRPAWTKPLWHSSILVG